MFTQNASWGPVSYLNDGQTAASVMDAGAAKLGAVDLVDGKLSFAWSQDQRTLSFTTLIGPTDQRVLIGTDILVTPAYGGIQHYLSADGHIYALQVVPDGS